MEEEIQLEEDERAEEPPDQEEAEEKVMMQRPGKLPCDSSEKRSSDS